MQTCCCFPKPQAMMPDSKTDLAMPQCCMIHTIKTQEERFKGRLRQNMEEFFLSSVIFAGEISEGCPPSYHDPMTSCESMPLSLPVACQIHCILFTSQESPGKKRNLSTIQPGKTKPAGTAL